MPPPKRKLVKYHCSSSGACRCKSKSCEGDASVCHTNPHVVIAPLMRDISSTKKYRFTALPASAALYNKPEVSDVHLRVGDDRYFAHHVVLGAASDVFGAMLGSDWIPGADNDRKQVSCSSPSSVPSSDVIELTLTEDAECVQVFDRFLYFMYSGNVVISESYVVPLFVLADKYNVKALYEECAKVIETGLKVFVVQAVKKKESISTLPSTSALESSSHWPNRYLSSSSSSASDFGADSSDDSEFEEPSARSTLPRSTRSAGTFLGELSNTREVSNTRLIPSETFPVVLVLRLLHYGHNVRIHQAALFNLEARVGNQISNGNYMLMWSELTVDVIIKMLADTRFCYPEVVLFDAAKVWLMFSEDRWKNDATVDSILQCIRYPLLTTSELYRVSNDPLVCGSARVKVLADEAVRYQLFSQCCSSDEDRSKWTGVQFEKRSSSSTN